MPMDVPRPLGPAMTLRIALALLTTLAVSVGVLPPTAGQTSGVDVIRLAGSERLATAVAISQDLYPDGGAAGAVLARSDIPADALVATSLARVGPLLLSPVDRLPPDVATELQRAVQPGATIFIAGGTAAISAEVEASLQGLGFGVARLGGSNRFETATLIANTAAPNPKEIFLADGGGFADALLAGAAAGQDNGVVVLSSGSELPPETSAYLADVSGVPVVGVGLAALNTGVVDVAVTGGNAYETSAAMAARHRGSSKTTAIATGEDFPDALAGGVHAATLGLPLLLTRTAELPEAVASLLLSTRPRQYVVYGGVAAVADDVLISATEATCATTPSNCADAPVGQPTGRGDVQDGQVLVVTLGGISPERIVRPNVPVRSLGRDGTANPDTPTFDQGGDPGRVLRTFRDKEGRDRVIRTNRLVHINDRGHNVAFHTLIKTMQLSDAEPDPRNVDAVVYETPAKLYGCDQSDGLIPIENCQVLAEELIRVFYLEVEQPDGQDYGVQTSFCVGRADERCPDWVNQYMNQFPQFN